MSEPDTPQIFTCGEIVQLGGATALYRVTGNCGPTCEAENSEQGTCQAVFCDSRFEDFEAGQRAVFIRRNTQTQMAADARFDYFRLQINGTTYMGFVHLDSVSALEQLAAVAENCESPPDPLCA